MSPYACENKITVSHDDVRSISRIVEAHRSNRLFDEFVPCPKTFDIKTVLSALKCNPKIPKFPYTNPTFWCLGHWGRFEDETDGISLDIISPNKIALTIMTHEMPPFALLDHWVQLGCTVSCASFDEDEWNIQIYKDGVYWRLRDGEGEDFDDIEPAVERLFGSFGGDYESVASNYY